MAEQQRVRIKQSIERPQAVLGEHHQNREDPTPHKARRRRGGQEMYLCRAKQRRKELLRVV
jgi:hypothetical protein